MAQTQSLFSAQSAVTTFSATTSAPTAVALASSGNTLRVCNEGAGAAFFAVASTAATAVAILPSNGSVLASYIGPGADATFSIPNTGTPLYVSAITRSGSAVVNFYVGEGV